MKKVKNPKDLKTLRQEILSARKGKDACITIASGTCGKASGATEVIQAIRDEVRNQGLEDTVNILVTGCHGFCEVEPIMLIQPEGIFYQHVQPSDAKDIVAQTVVKKQIIEKLLYTDPMTGEKITYEKDIPFYKKQMRLILGNNAFMDPTRIEDYIALDGYNALAKMLTEMTPEKVIDEVTKSGLRGRGGAGFDTGWKWEACRDSVLAARDKGEVSEGSEAYVICNADEGDPGCFQDRNILEGNPHSVLEGMMVSAFAIGASEGYVYVRDEYPLAVEHVRLAIKQAEEYGLLGDNILGTGFNFRINVNRGGGAFVCGESSALIASIEGRVGEPRPKHTHATERGLWNKPTALNNVKTLAIAPLIINRGSEWYSKIGTEKSKGTMIFSLVGNINNTGLVEVPMGITLRELVYDIGGGLPDNKKLKAIQTGGPSGGCVPESLLDLPVDYEKLSEAGSMMGSGGMIILDETTCIVNIAKYFLDFTREESCGKCTPCREGVQVMANVLERMINGEGEEGDLELLEEMSEYISKASLCALGKSAPNPVTSTFRYFRDEYETHLKDKKCPAGVCKPLITYSIDPELCTGCTLCSTVCGQGAIEGDKKVPHKIEQTKCNKCGACMEICKKAKAVIVQ